MVIFLWKRIRHNREMTATEDICLTYSGMTIEFYSGYEKRWEVCTMMKMNVVAALIAAVIAVARGHVAPEAFEVLREQQANTRKHGSNRSNGHRKHRADRSNRSNRQYRKYRSNRSNRHRKHWTNRSDWSNRQYRKHRSNGSNRPWRQWCWLLMCSTNGQYIVTDHSAISKRHNHCCNGKWQ